MATARSTPSSEDIPDAEFARVLRTADPGPALDRPLTFLPPSGCPAAAWHDAWTAWLDLTLTGTIAPVLAAVARHAERGEVREILALDLALSEALDPAACARSAAVGALCLRRLSSARGERSFHKFQRAAVAGAAPAHFSVVYAVQSVLFHLPLRLLLPGYAYWEWTAAMAAAGPAGGPIPAFTAEAAGLRQLAGATLSAHGFDAAQPFRVAANAS